MRGEPCWEEACAGPPSPQSEVSGAQLRHTQEPSSAPCLHVIHGSRILLQPCSLLLFFQAVALDLS